MLTLELLIRRTPQSVMDRGMKDCRVTVNEIEIKKDKDGLHKYCSGVVRSETIDRVVVIKYYKPKNKNLALSPVWAHCSCEYHKYTVEAINARKGSSSKILSNGMSPMVRNPNNVNHFCKHLVAFARVSMKLAPKGGQALLDIDHEVFDTNPPKKLPLPEKPKTPEKPKGTVGIKPMKGIKPLPTLGPTRPAKP